MVPLQATIKGLNRESGHLFEAFDKESDRGLALVTAEFFNASLERLLRARFGPGLRKQPKLMEPLFAGFGPLSTFSAKIKVSYGAELLQDWMASDLDIVRRIRNEFAHSLASRSFRDPEVSSMVEQLAGPPATHLLKESRDKMSAQLGRPPTLEEMARTKFILVCGWIGAQLQSKVVVLEGDSPEEFKRSFVVAPTL